MGSKQRLRADRRENERNQGSQDADPALDERIEEDAGEHIEVKVAAAPEDDGYEKLKRDYDKLLADRDRAQNEARQVRDTAAREKRTLETKLASQEIETHGAVLLHELAAAKADADTAENSYAQAMASGDYAGAAKAQREMAKAESRITRLEEGYHAIEERKKQPVAEERPEPAQLSKEAQVDAHIAQGGYSPKTQAWLSRNKADIWSSDRRVSRAWAGHALAVSEGIEPDSAEYFEFLDSHMGYGQEPEREAPVQRTPAPKQRTPAAPPSRDGGTSPRTSQVYLTKDEADAAKAMGMTNARYAQIKKEIQDGKHNVRFS